MATNVGPVTHSNTRSIQKPNQLLSLSRLNGRELLGLAGCQSFVALSKPLKSYFDGLDFFMLLITENKIYLFHRIHPQDLLNDTSQSIPRRSEIRRSKNQVNHQIRLMTAVIEESQPLLYFMVSLT